LIYLPARVTVLKFGGSLFADSAELLREVRVWGGSCLIVPGGGPFADTVREFQKRFDLSDDSAHWMAVAGCEQYAFHLADTGGMEITGELAIPEKPVVLTPYRIMREHDPLPHSWGAASDCIAAWCARELSARFIKVTDVGGVMLDGRIVGEIDASWLIEMPQTCLDLLLPQYLLEWGMDVLVVGGSTDNLGRAMRGEDAMGTKVRGR